MRSGVAAVEEVGPFFTEASGQPTARLVGQK